MEVGVESEKAKGVEGDAQALRLGEGEGMELVRDAEGKSVHGVMIAWHQNGVKMMPWQKGCGQICA